MTTGKHKLHRKASLGASATPLPEHWGVSSPVLLVLPSMSLPPEQNLVFHTITNKVKITQYTSNKKCLTNPPASPTHQSTPFLSGELETQAAIILRSQTTHTKVASGDRHQRYILQLGESRRMEPNGVLSNIVSLLSAVARTVLSSVRSWYGRASPLFYSSSGRAFHPPPPSACHSLSVSSKAFAFSSVILCRGQEATTGDRPHLCHVRYQAGIHRKPCSLATSSG